MVALVKCVNTYHVVGARPSHNTETTFDGGHQRVPSAVVGVFSENLDAAGNEESQRGWRGRPKGL